MRCSGDRLGSLGLSPETSAMTGPVVGAVVALEPLGAERSVEGLPVRSNPISTQVLCHVPFVEVGS